MIQKTIAALLTIAVGAYGIHSWYARQEMTERFVAALPGSIEPVGFVMRSARTGLFNALVPDACGTNAIHISRQTAERIKRQGLAFFDTAAEGRAPPRPGRGPVQYFNWRKAPGQAQGHLGESLIMSVFSCAGRSGIPSGQIIEGMKSGNYYIAGRHSTEYYVLPDQRLFVQVFQD